MGQKISFDLLIEKLMDYYNEFKEEYKDFIKKDFKLLPNNAFKGKIAEAFNIMIFIWMIDSKTKIYTPSIESMNLS